MMLATVTGWTVVWAIGAALLWYAVLTFRIPTGDRLLLAIPATMCTAVLAFELNIVEATEPLDAMMLLVMVFAGCVLSFFVFTLVKTAAESYRAKKSAALDKES
jgi:hypothetical protein